MGRLGILASSTDGGEKNCSREFVELLAETALAKTVRPVPHEPGEKTITHRLRPTDLIRLIHSRNRRKFGLIFGAGRANLASFWESVFSTGDGQEINKKNHPTLRLKQPEQLQASIPIVVHEDAAPYQKKRSVNVLQWGPLFYHGSDIESRFVHHAYINKEESAAAASRAWSLFWEDVDRLDEGYDEHGDPYCKGCRRHRVEVRVHVLRTGFRNG